MYKDAQSSYKLLSSLYLDCHAHSDQSRPGKLKAQFARTPGNHTLLDSVVLLLCFVQSSTSACLVAASTFLCLQKQHAG